MRWRSVSATQDERTRPLPGDALITHAVGSLTHAITIHGSARRVWPWLAQMGAGSRAGWYSYDFLDNGRLPSATRIRDDLQDISVGDLFPAMPGATDGFHLLAFEVNRYIAIGWRPSPSSEPIMTWTFVLEERPDGTTRLVVRARASAAYPFYGLPPRIGLPLIRMVHAVMQRKQLLGIASRVETCQPHAQREEKEAA